MANLLAVVFVPIYVWPMTGLKIFVIALFSTLGLSAAVLAQDTGHPVSETVEPASATIAISERPDTPHPLECCDWGGSCIFSTRLVAEAE